MKGFIAQYTKYPNGISSKRQSEPTLRVFAIYAKNTTTKIAITAFNIVFIVFFVG
jgi:hypothetical protein